MKRKFLISLLVLIFHFHCAEKGKAGYNSCKLEGTPPHEKKEYILFGDLHSHSINSLDAFVMNFPLVESANPTRGPLESCYFARFCAQLDFWALTDHAEEIPLWLWEENVNAIRKCNDLFGGYTYEPEMVSYLGWEWSRNSTEPATDWGHRNVVLKDTCDQKIPPHPIAATTGFVGLTEDDIKFYSEFLRLIDPQHADFYTNAEERILSFFSEPVCPENFTPSEMETNCHESADSPQELYSRLDAYGVDALVIPHGLSWGPFHPEPGNWKHQLSGGNHQNSKYEVVIEVYSGHGNMEEYRPWRHVIENSDGSLSCPAPTTDFVPCCWRAGEIAMEKSPNCTPDPQNDACIQDIKEAQDKFIKAKTNAFLEFSDVSAEEWLDCGECRDCFQPPDMHSPLNSVQAILAYGDFNADPSHRYHILGFVGSTDNHMAGPGAGYKELKNHTDILGASSADFESAVEQLGVLVLKDLKRQNSYFYTGGLVAVHSYGRSREEIWEAIKARRVYATSGDRILLWFYLMNSPEGVSSPMGAVVHNMKESPQFKVKAVGAPKQNPGCPPEIIEKAPPGVIESLCHNECYYPTFERYRIVRIEVVKITPQTSPDENLDALIKDPFLVRNCPDNTTSCEITFTDPDYSKEMRPAFYYVRAIQEPTYQVNADNLRCEYDENGNCLSVNPCTGGYKGRNDDCLSEDEERAWSSPIYLFPSE